MTTDIIKYNKGDLPIKAQSREIYFEEVTIVII